MPKNVARIFQQPVHDKCVIISLKLWLRATPSEAFVYVYGGKKRAWDKTDRKSIITFDWLKTIHVNTLNAAFRTHLDDVCGDDCFTNFRLLNSLLNRAIKIKVDYLVKIQLIAFQLIA